MNKETIETIITNLAKKGYNTERKEIGDGNIYADFGDYVHYLSGLFPVLTGCSKRS